MNIKNIQELIEGTAISSEPIIFGRGTELRRQSIADFITTFNLGGASGIPNIDIQETSYSNLVILNGTLPSSIPTLITIPDNQLRFIRIAVVSSFTGAISQNLYLLTERGEDLILQDILWSTSILIDSIPFDATEASNTTTYNVSSLAELNASDPALPFNQSGQEYFVNLNGTLYFFVGNPAEYGVGASTMEMTDLQLVSDSSKKSELKTYRVDPNNLAQIISEVNGAGTFILDNPENTLIKAVFISEQGQPFETSTRVYQIITNPNTGLNNLIAGNFGTGGQQINSTNLELIHTSEVTATDISELSNTVTFEYNIGAGNLIDYINDLDPSIVVANPNTNLTLFRITANGVLFEYLYVGEGATYGINDDEITTSDLQLVNDESVGIDLSTGLEAIDEGNGIGWRLKGKEPAFFGDVGLNAVDLSTSLEPSSSRGATGNSSFTEGFYTTASGNDSHAEGVFSTAEGQGSHAEGFNVLASGNYSHAEGNNTISSGQQSHAEGSTTIASGLSSHSQNAETTASGYGSSAEGINNFARAQGEHSGGRFGTDYTPQVDGTDRIMNYGIGTTGNDRKDGLTLFKNGALRIWRATLASITNAAAGFLIFDSDDNNRPTVHNGTEWKALSYRNEPLEDSTFANLPAGIEGQIRYITDADAISYRATAVGGGTEKALVFFDGTNWIYH